MKIIPSLEQCPPRAYFIGFFSLTNQTLTNRTSILSIGLILKVELNFINIPPISNANIHYLVTQLLPIHT